jgi:hypothetical protein
MAGVGTHISKLIAKWLRIKTGGCGGCKELLEKLNREGPAWCRTHLRHIVPQIRANARKNEHFRARILARIPGASRPIRALVMEAIRRAEADLKAEAQK